MVRRGHTRRGVLRQTGAEGRYDRGPHARTAARYVRVREALRLTLSSIDGNHDGYRRKNCAASVFARFTLIQQTEMPYQTVKAITNSLLTKA